MNPGQPGTRRWMVKYGDDLVCVRYRYDAERDRRFTTVEIIVDEFPWKKKSTPINKIMYLRVGINEPKIQRVIKLAGGRWNRDLKLWELAYKEVMTLGFADRVVDAAEMSGKK